MLLSDSRKSFNYCDYNCITKKLHKVNISKYLTYETYSVKYFKIEHIFNLVY